MKMVVSVFYFIEAYISIVVKLIKMAEKKLFYQHSKILGLSSFLGNFNCKVNLQNFGLWF